MTKLDQMLAHVDSARKEYRDAVDAFCTDPDCDAVANLQREQRARAKLTSALAELGECFETFLRAGK
jgi:hypothetical protein